MYKNSPIYVLDFDGVICDSTPECMVSAWNAWNKNHKKEYFFEDLSHFSKKQISEFRLLRPFVKGAGEYFTLMKILEEQNVTSINLLKYSEEVKKNKIKNIEFKKDFYFARKKLRNLSEKKWVELHYIYKPVINFMKKIDKNSLCIATLKDRESVSLILKAQGLELSDSQIIDESMINNKLDALNIYVKKLKKKKNEIIFIDDNVTHLLDPFKEGFSVFLSTWCNCSEETRHIALKSGIKLLNNINEL